MRNDLELHLSWDNWYTNEFDLQILKFYSNYSFDDKYIFCESEYNSSLINLVKEKTNLIEMINNQSSYEAALTVCKWVNNLAQNGRSAIKKLKIYDSKYWNASDILERALNRQMGFDCWTISFFLCEILNSLGYNARWIQCLPLDFRQMDSHCITLVYIDSLKKWIILDAGQGGCYICKDEMPLNLSELRSRLIDGRPIFLNNLETPITDTLRWYLIKNSIKFHSILKSSFTYLNQNSIIHYFLYPCSLLKPQDKKLTTNYNEQTYIYTTDDKKFWEPINRRENAS